MYGECFFGRLGVCGCVWGLLGFFFSDVIEGKNWRRRVRAGGDALGRIAEVEGCCLQSSKSGFGVNGMATIVSFHTFLCLLR